jgi:hypothetical protein
MNRMQHIYLEVNLDGEWIPLDPIMKNRPAGYAAPSYTAKKVFDLGELRMHPNSRVPFVSMNGHRRSRGRLTGSAIRRPPGFLSGDWRDNISAPSGGMNGLGALSIFKPLKNTFTRLYGSEAEKSTLREKNRIETANRIFSDVAAGKAVPLTGVDSLQYAIQVYNDNKIPIPKLPAGLQQQAAAAKVSMTATSGSNIVMLAGIGIGALVLAKVLKIF